LNLYSFRLMNHSRLSNYFPPVAADGANYSKIHLVNTNSQNKRNEGRGVDVKGTRFIINIA